MTHHFPQNPSSATSEFGAATVREGQVQGSAREHQGLLPREGLSGEQGEASGRWVGQQFCPNDWQSEKLINPLRERERTITREFPISPHVTSLTTIAEIATITVEPRVGTLGGGIKQLCRKRKN